MPKTDRSSKLSRVELPLRPSGGGGAATLQQVIEVSPSKMVVVDTDLCIVAISDSLVTLGGWSGGSPAGLSLDEVVPAFASEVRRAVEDAVRAHRSGRIDRLWNTPAYVKGREWGLSCRLLDDGTTEIAHACVTLREVDQSPAEAGTPASLYRNLAELSGDCNYALGYAPDGALVYYWFSPSIQQVSGYRPDELAAVGLDRLVHPDDFAAVAAMIRRLPSPEEEPMTQPGRIITRSGEVRWMRQRMRKVVGADGGVMVYASIRDVTDLRHAEDHMRYRASLVDAIGEAVISMDPDLCIVSWSSGAETLYGWKAEEVIGRWITEVLPTELGLDVERDALERLEREGHVRYSTRKRCRNGAVIEVKRTLSALTDSSGHDVGMLALDRDLTEVRRGQARLQESELRFRHLVEASPGAYIVAAGEEIRYVNDAACRLLGVEGPEELIGRVVFDFLPEDRREKGRLRLARIQEEARPFGVVEETFLRADGSLAVVEVGAAPVTYEGRAAVQILAVDVSERNQAQHELRASLAEKEMLLREVHHRVKNNLQVVSSLLQLQSRYVDDPRDARRFLDSQERVQSIALVHEMLHQSMNFAGIDFKDYLQQLTATLAQSYSGGPSHIGLELSVQGMHLDPDWAITCGLIVNELVNNAYVHAFPTPSDADALTVRLRPLGDDHVELSVIDNGVGLPSDFDHARSRQLGLKLVEQLGRKLGAEVSFTSPPGTCVTLCLPKDGH